MMSRSDMVDLAQVAAETTARRAAGLFGPLRVVVVVTDADGDWLGVGTTTGRDDTDAILRCALEAEGRIDRMTLTVAAESPLDAGEG